MPGTQIHSSSSWDDDAAANGGLRQSRRQSVQSDRQLITLNRLSRMFADPQVAICYGILGFGVLLCANDTFAPLVCFLVSFILPAVRSLRASESTGKDDDNYWLIYWIVFALFSMVELIDFFICLPFYQIVKCLFLIWCMLPVPWNGSKFIHDTLLRPEAEARPTVEGDIDSDHHIVEDNAVEAAHESEVPEPAPARAIAVIDVVEETPAASIVTGKKED